MQHSKYVRAATLVAFGLAAFSQLACAQSKSGSQTDPVTQALVRFSQSGHDAIHEIDDARLAIFNGDVDIAKQMLADAKMSMANAKKEAPTFTNTTTMTVQGKEVSSQTATMKVDVVPVDGDVVLAEDYVPTPEKTQHIDKANSHLKNGEQKEAIEELQLADIDVNLSRVWMPISSSEKHLDDAIALLNDNKYYEANLALKAIEDGLTVDSETIEADEEEPTAAAKK